ncbi:VOC family protein [Nocardia aurantiaca]|uniref:VOC family protein n=1 Tax=Nocardia aurantiaca TaxID=2675850 RepID=A0A6I3KVR5_9NOCA|nr:VOC family protein [Nocardia aurantiaca]MTE13667.1 VOC family protein [Nocardia aurantiaca]
MTIRWVWAFLDRPAAQFDAAAEFWTTITGTELSPRRGEHDEFVTLLPDSGAATLKMQSIDGPARVHLDLDVDDVGAATERAEKLGATLAADYILTERIGYAVLHSPAGMPFCFTPFRDSAGPLAPTVTGPARDRSRLDQICLDIGTSDYAEEARFWTALTGWAWRPGTLPEFARLSARPEIPIDLLLQRLGDDRPTSAHPDLACTDIDATADWHEQLGAHRGERGKHWLVMADPCGAPYCLTSRKPA